MTPIRVMIVEDEALLVVSLKLALESLGYKVTGHAFDGNEARALLSRETPDVILMDVTLGSEDGVALAAEIIKTRGIPVVFLTGYSDAITMKRLESVAHSGVLAKPAEDFELDGALKRAARKT